MHVSVARKIFELLPLALAFVAATAHAWMPNAAFWLNVPQGIQLFAGALGGVGSLDATGTAARFYNVQGITVDSSGNLYLTDSYNDTIRVVTAAGVASTLAGLAINAGATDGTGAAARFRIPTGVARDSSGNLFVVDSLNQNIRKVTTAGVTSIFAGSSSSGFVNGTGTAASFNNPQAITIDGSGNLYVADSNNYAIRKITSAGVVTTLAGSGSFGSANGTGTAATFSNMLGLVVDGSGNVFVADTYNHMIRKITSAGAVTTLAGSTSGGYTNATGTSAKFAYPHGITIDGSGNLYVADFGNQRIRKVTSGGGVTLLAGSGNVGTANGASATAQFNGPFAIAYDSTTSSVYVTEAGTSGGATSSSGSTIRQILVSNGTTTTFAGQPLAADTVQGSRLTARFNNPLALTHDSKGNIFIVDNGQSLIRKIASDGTVSTFAGNPSLGETDGTGTSAGFKDPVGITVDASNNLYVTDRQGETIRKITPAAVVTTFAGTANTGGFANGTGTAATFTYPCGITIDGSGNLYVADYYNGAIRKITPAGVVTTLAGGNAEADGTGTGAGFTFPYGVAADSAGNVYVTDQGPSTVRKVTAAGVVTTLAGKSGFAGSTDGTGAAARFTTPTAIAISPAGNIYVSDMQAYTIRKITPAGVTTTVAGVANQGSTTVGAFPGHVAQVMGMMFSGAYLYFISDFAILKASTP